MRFKYTAPTEANALFMKGKPWNLHRPKTHRSGPCTKSPLLIAVENTNVIPHVTELPLKVDNRANALSNESHKRKWRRFHVRLPPPRYLLHYSARQRLSAALLSTVLCITLLTHLIPLFSTKLHTSKAELGTGNGLLGSSVSAHSLFRSTSGLPGGRAFHPRRRLASLQATQAPIPTMKNYSSRMLDRFRQNMGSLTASALSSFLGSQHAWHGSSPAFPRTGEKDGGYTTVVSIYHVRNGRAKPAPPPALQAVRSTRMPRMGQLVERKPPVVPSAHGSAPNFLEPSQARANSLHTDVLNAAREAPSIAASKLTGHNSRQGPRFSEVHGPKPTVSQQRPHPISPQLGKQEDKMKEKEQKMIKTMETAALSDGMIEIWMLRSGSSLCRIYNAGRLLEGKLLLPLWMKKHSVVLLHQCGVKNPVFAIKSKSQDKPFVFDKKALNMSGEVRIIDKTNMDLVGSRAPRHHIPHFASDILFPLIVTEILKGSGSDVAKHAFIRKSSPPSSLEVTRASFDHLRPSLFLREETWQVNSSAWVRRLANFFLHPAVGFAFLSEEDRLRPSRWVSYNKSNVLWRFRSVLSSNWNIYEADGLFDKNGDNFVLSHNGLSGAPAWTIKGISQKPCRVSVTALTRPGPRALQNLDVVKKTAAKLFASGGLRLDFKVVMFENAEFDTQVNIMQETNVLIATHGAGNANLIFLRRGATIIEVFPFAYRAGPFDGLARIFDLDYKTAMSVPQTKVFKECMNRFETSDGVRRKVFGWWDKAVSEEKKSPWVHRLELEKEFGDPGKPEGMATRRCVRMQQLVFDTATVAAMAFESAKRQCNDLRFRSRSVHVR